VKNVFSKSESKRLQDWITRVVEMPLPQVGSEELWGFMMKDKKNENGNVSDL
jgi:hypothetical protein